MPSIASASSNSSSSGRVAVALSSIGADYVPLLQAITRVLTPEIDGLSTTSQALTRLLLGRVADELAGDLAIARSGKVFDPATFLGPNDPALHLPAFEYSGSPIDAPQAFLEYAIQERARGFTSSAVCGIVFCTTQLCNYVLHSDKVHDRLLGSGSGSSSDAGVVLPFCGGSFPAYAIAQASTSQELIELGVRMARMAFWTGLQSDRTAAHARVNGLCGTVAGDQSAPTAERLLANGSWCVAAVGWTREQLDVLLARLNSQAKVGQLQLYISAFLSAKSFSVSGPPGSMDAMELLLLREAALDASKSKRVMRVPIFTPYHSTNALHGHATEFLSIADKLDLFEPNARLRCQIQSTVDGNLMSTTELRGQDITDMICLNPCRWDKSVDTLIDRTLDEKKLPLNIVNVGPGGRLAGSIITAFGQRGVNAKSPESGITVLDIEAMTLEMAQRPEVAAAATAVSQEAIAVVGHACRFPGGADTPEKFFELLQSGKIPLERIPKERFNIDDYLHEARPGQPNTINKDAVYGSFLENIDQFDARFFSISPREAEQMDPQHRIFTMCAHEALEKSGYAADKTPSFTRDRMGAFLGASNDDYRDNASVNIGSFLITGNARAFLPGRVSFLNNWIGPSISVDTGDMSSFTALETAVETLLADKCDTALVGGVATCTGPVSWISLDKAGLLIADGPDSRMLAQSAGTNGFVRAEGCGVLVLKRLSQAVAEGDNILATIGSTASTFAPNPKDGMYGTTVHDAIAEAEVHRVQVEARRGAIVKALAKAGLAPAQVDYVECNASGFRDDEATEIEALHAVFSKKQPVFGTLKTAMGNAEAASGIASLLKVVELLRTDGLPETVATALVNDYSYGGGNGTVVLRKYVDQPMSVSGVADPRKNLPFVLSAKTLCSLQRQLTRVLGMAERQSADAFKAICYTATDRRNTDFSYRFAAQVGDLEQLKAALKSGKDAIVQAPPASKAPQAAFFFCGQGSQYASMASRLMQSSKTFRTVLAEVERVLTQDLGFPGFLGLVTGAEGSDVTKDHAGVQCAIFAIEYALAQMLGAWGIRPAAVGGHSLGEYAALAVSGVLSLRDALFLVATRAHLLISKVQPYTAGMLSAVMSSESAQAFLDKHAADATQGCEIACENGPKATVIAGPKEKLVKASALLKAEGVKNIILEVAFAFHSAQVEPILDDLHKAASKVTFHAPQIPVVSNVLGDLVTKDGIFDADYLVNHSRRRVRFAKGVESLVEQAKSNPTLKAKLGHLNVGLELGPDSIMLGMVRDSVAGTAKKPTDKFLSQLLPVLKKKQDDLEMVGKALTTAYLAGLPVDWFAHNEDFVPAKDRRRCYDFPSYSFDIDRHWIEFKDRGLIAPGTKVLLQHEEGTDAGVESDDEDVEDAPLPPSKFSLLNPTSAKVYPENKAAECLFEATYSGEMLRFVKGHRVGGIALVPAALNAAFCMEAAHYTYEQCVGSSVPRLRMTNLHITGPLTWHLDPAKTGNNPRIKVRCTADFGGEQPVFSCMVSSESVKRGAGGKFEPVTALHATCSVLVQDSVAKMEADFAAVEPLLLREIERLESEGDGDSTVAAAEEEEVTTLDTKLAYELFGAVVEYDGLFQSMSQIRMNSTTGIATAHLGGHHERNPGAGRLRNAYVENPLSLDAMSQLTGLMANIFLVDEQHSYITESCDDARLLPEVYDAERAHEPVTVLATVRREDPGSAQYVLGDCYIFKRVPGASAEGGERRKLVGTILNAKYQLLRSQGLAAVLKRTLG
ncbi:hypothetical protein OC842_000385 [Tilletia horrida]|uniref:Carrier domain-containing protein n=1 Tax=Tilletia horrida TaxID=155126 RepID=A0AAN6GJE0_9BASI|nr:hypothetical protein OC842_000385 [Tilletia horrida]